MKNLRRPWVLLLGAGTLAALGVRGWLASPGGTAEVVYTEPVSSRSYTVLTRAQHDRTHPAPVLFALHAYATAPQVLVRSYFLRLLAVKNRGFILVIPEGLRDADGHHFWNASSACCGKGSARPDDLGYLRHVLEDVKRRYAVDATRVTAIGVSNGGFMAYRWASSPGTELTAIASISGAGLGSQEIESVPTTPVSVLHIHGDADDVVRYDGGSLRDDYPSARGSVAPFLRLAELDGRRARIRKSHPLGFDSIRKEDWSASGKRRVSLWTVEGGGHHLRTVRLMVPEILAFLLGR